MSRPLKAAMLERLARSGSWVAGPELAAGLSSSQMAIEDALADLVVEQLAEYKAAVGYRLKGTALCRQALRLLKTEGGARAVCARPLGAEYRVGVAEALADLGLVMYELALPLPPEGPDHLQQHMRQAEAIMKFTTGEISNG